MAKKYRLNLMDSTQITAFVTSLIVSVTGLIGAVGLFRRNNSEQERETKKAELERRKEEQDMIQDAFKTVTDALKEEVKRTQDRLGEAQGDIRTLQDGRHDRDLRIKELEDKQKDSDKRQVDSDKQIATLTKSVEMFTAELAKKDEVIATQGEQLHTQSEQITQLQTDNERLTKRVRLLEEALIKAEVPIPNGDSEK